MNELAFLIEMLEQDLLLEANNRSKVTAKLKAKSDARKPKFFSYDGTSKSYMAGAKRVLGDIKYRSLIRASKKKPHEYNDAAVGRLLAGYDAKTNTIAINKPRMTERKKMMGGRSKYSIKPFLKHELEHHEQTLRAKDLGGNQNVRRLDARYHSQVFRTRPDGSKVIDSTKYANHPMERNANVTAINGPNSKDRDKTVKQTIGYKRKKNKVFVTNYKDGRAQLRNMVNAGRKNK